ncbi:unnamed protein product [Meloidogyne enterolobii]|uniref:Uncharacterized protein n=2 Tax=Meloidogyne enterolobii TaxID=390850 RepID=A0ACB1BA19_MELEN
MLGIAGAVPFSNDFVLKEEAFCIIEGIVAVIIFVSIVEGVVGDVFGNTVVFLVSTSFDFCLGIFCCPPPPRFVVVLFKGERMSKSPVTRLTSGPV